MIKDRLMRKDLIEKILSGTVKESMPIIESLTVDESCLLDEELSKFLEAWYPKVKEMASKPNEILDTDSDFIWLNQQLQFQRKKEVNPDLKIVDELNREFAYKDSPHRKDFMKLSNKEKEEFWRKVQVLDNKMMEENWLNRKGWR